MSPAQGWAGRPAANGSNWPPRPTPTGLSFRSHGVIDGFGDLVSEHFIEHDEMPGLAPTKAGVLGLFRGYRAALPDLHMDAVDVIASGDKTSGGCRRGEPRPAELSAIYTGGRTCPGCARAGLGRRCCYTR